MRADGHIERFDELINVLQFVSDDGTRRASNASEITLYTYIEEALQYYQGYYIPHPRSGWTGVFPYAWYLRQGMKVENTTVGDIYEIKEVERDGNNLPTGRVVMSGTVAPEQHHRLRFNREDALIFMHAYPKTFAQTYRFKGGQLLAEEKPRPWRDTITYLVDRKEPAGRGGKPFEGTRDVRRHHRGSESWSPDDGFQIDYYGQWFDTIVQFDCWSKTNVTAERLIVWLEGFLEQHIGVFKYNGIQQMLYWRRSADELVTRWRDDIVNRSLQYYIRFENVGATLERKVSSLVARIGLTPTGTIPADAILYGTGWVMPSGEVGIVPVEVTESRLGG